MGVTRQGPLARGDSWSRLGDSNSRPTHYERIPESLLTSIDCDATREDVPVVSQRSGLVIRVLRTVCGLMRARCRGSRRVGRRARAYGLHRAVYEPVGLTRLGSVEVPADRRVQFVQLGVIRVRLG